MYDKVYPIFVTFALNENSESVTKLHVKLTIELELCGIFSVFDMLMVMKAFREPSSDGHEVSAETVTFRQAVKE